MHRCHPGHAALARCGVLVRLGHAARWFVHEALPFPVRPAASSLVAAGCRGVGCCAMATILYVELRNGVAPSALLAITHLSVSALTAVLLGNIVRECAFSVCSALTTCSGHAFFREGITLGGVKFEEVHYPGGTWLRCESGLGIVTCEWTEPDGSCRRTEIRAEAATEGMTCYTSAPSRPW
jgi:hypothetical protein